MTVLNHRYPAIQGEGELEEEWEAEAEWEAEEELESETELAGGGRAAFLSETEDETESEWEWEAESELEEEYEFEFEAEAEAESEAEGELEDEFEAEDEDEAEGFVNPVRRVYRDAELMAHLARQASDAESESEAEAFIGALVPLAARLIPRAATLVARNAPTLLRGATRIARRLRRDPQTRQLVRAMPVILQRTAQSLADQTADGVDVDGADVVRTLGTITGRVLRGPGRSRALRAVNVFDRRWHRRTRWDRARLGLSVRRTVGRSARVPNPYLRRTAARRPVGSWRPRTTGRAGRRDRRR